MCNLETEGTKYGCGHYVMTRQTAKLDCGSRYCTLSRRHPQTCNSSDCNQYYGPDRKEVVTLTTPDYCTQCEYWYNGPGSRRR